MSFGNRRWFIAPGGSFFHGKVNLGTVYHYFLKEYSMDKGYTTACGVKGLQGKFVDLRLTKKQERAARCEKCIAARRRK